MHYICKNMDNIATLLRKRKRVLFRFRFFFFSVPFCYPRANTYDSVVHNKPHRNRFDKVEDNGERKREYEHEYILPFFGFDNR